MEWNNLWSESLKLLDEIAGKAEKNGKKFLKKISDAGKRFGNKVGTTLNNASDAVSDRQINKKK